MARRAPLWKGQRRDGPGAGAESNNCRQLRGEDGQMARRASHVGEVDCETGVVRRDRRREGLHFAYVDGETNAFVEGKCEMSAMLEV